MGRFASEDWLQLGERLLKAEGPGALTIERLTAAAGKTRGSFYHHFKGRDAFLEALLAAWQQATTETLAARLEDAASAEAKTEILRGVSMALDGKLERALRQLAAAEPLVAEHLARVDEIRIQGLAGMVALLQPDVADPYSYAFVQYASVVGGQWLLHAPDDPRIPAIREAGNAIFGL